MLIAVYGTRADLTAAFNERALSTRQLHLVQSSGIAYELDPVGRGFVEKGYVDQLIYPGAKLFQLKATHGLPLDAALEAVLKNYGSVYRIDWTSFITEARKNKWYDFQTLPIIEEALLDVAPGERSRKLMILLKRWVLDNPLTEF